VSDGPDRRILLTGASGYVGGRLLAHLEARGLTVRCLARRPEFLAGRVGPLTQIVPGDALREETLPAALEGVDTAYYLIHSMASPGSAGFEEQDRIAAQNFGRAARAAGVRRIVYLGGLGDESGELSPHLRSRHEVGRVLRESGVSVIEFRASIVIGSGSLSFEMIRSLVERLPVMVTPRWVSVIAQPIAIEDLLAYLEAALDLETPESRIYEIGGAERVSYSELMRAYAASRGLRRVMLPVPVLTPRISSLWLALVTPLFARVGRTLIESICHETVVRDTRARRDFGIAPMGARQAIERALANEDRDYAQTRWSDAFSSAAMVGSAPAASAVRHGRRLVDSRHRIVPVAPIEAFEPIRRIGGETGWYAFDWLWRLRGFIDLLWGGVGMRRGRPDPEHLRVGDTVDWWRVEACEEGHLLRLRAEMKVPGRAWLEFEVTRVDEGSRIQQTAVFDPSGLSGLLYWYAIYPLHALVFRSLLAGIARATRPGVKRRAAAIRMAATLALVLLCSATARSTTAELARADALWARRAEGHVNAVARPEPVRAAIEAYERAIAADPRNLEPYWKLLRALWFSADFASADEAQERRTYEQAQAVSEKAFAVLAERVGGRPALDALTSEALAARLPEADRRDAARLYFWTSVNLGAWSRIAGLLQAVRAGVAGRVHEAALRSIALDPDVEQGGAIRMLSRLHSELPRVPLLSGWVDHEQAVPLAERALREYPQHPGNSYLLGLAILSNAPDRASEGLALIERTARLEPRSDQLVEDLAIRIDARKRLEQATRQAQ
jgi:uncharacterized protein YbjT (DUF2867 family)/tetratricopeptide (TPR) repeat protein